MRNTLTRYIELIFLISCFVALAVPSLAADGILNQDQQWINVTTVDKNIVENDFNSLSAGINKNSISTDDLDKLTDNFQKNSTVLINDSQIALNHSTNSTVSRNY